MKIVADQNMPLVADLFGQFGEVYMMPGRDICADAIIDADMLGLLSDFGKSNLLAGSSVKFVGSATAGIDHIDKHYPLTTIFNLFTHLAVMHRRLLSTYCPVGSLSSEWQSKRGNSGLAMWVAVSIDP